MCIGFSAEAKKPPEPACDETARMCEYVVVNSTAEKIIEKLNLKLSNNEELCLLEANLYICQNGPMRILFGHRDNSKFQELKTQVPTLDLEEKSDEKSLNPNKDAYE